VTFVDDTACIRRTRGNDRCCPDLARPALIVVFSHRYTRTLALSTILLRCWRRSARSCSRTCTPGETPLAGADGKSLARGAGARRRRADLRRGPAELPAVLGPILRADDVVLTLGAGRSAGRADCRGARGARARPVQK
jgi:UDP-N-acetylmuramate-alanine ligase